METAVVMAIWKHGYIEPNLEPNEALQGFVRGNDVLVYLPTGTRKSLYYAMRQATRAKPLSTRVACAYTRNTYCACNFHILHVTPDVKIHPHNQEN